MAKAEEEGGADAVVKKVVIDDGPETDAELKLKEETEKAKRELIDQIKNFNADDAEAAILESEDQPEDPRVQKFTVTDPVKVSGHIKYTVTGIDDEGEFKEQRRFREFHALSIVLRTRWPGCYVPAIPEKKLLNSNDQQFIEDRRQLLERFVKEIAKFDYIVFSKEFKVFVRGQGEIDKVLQALPKQTPLQVLEKYRLNFKINEECDSNQMNAYSESIQRFLHYLKKAIGVMQMQKR